MKILFVSAVLPYPLFSGGQIRIYNLLKKLSKDHEIILYAFIRNEKERAHVAELSFLKKVVLVHRGSAWRPKYVVKSVLGPYPLLFESYHNSQMLSLLADELAIGKYDLVHLEPGYVWPSLPKTSTPVVVAEHNIEHTIYEDFVRQVSLPILRPPMHMDVAKMKRWEKRIWKEATNVIAVSPDDKAEIESASGRGDIRVVPNGVDLASFPYNPKKSISLTNPIFLYVGSFAWMQNRDAVQYLVSDIWPSLKAKYPGAQLHVVGRNAPKTLVETLTRSDIRIMNRVENIQKEFASADVLLAPLRIGGGTKFKVLEAMAAGVPVVTTPLGATGMNVTERDICIAENAEDFIVKTEQIIFDDKKRMDMVDHARRVIETHYSWDTIAKELDEVWREAI